MSRPKLSNPAPAITVVTPTKNRLALLRETLDSVSRQRFADWEHIVVDDGSDDGTREEVLTRAATDPRVRYLERSGKLAGANPCRNQGIAAARSDLLVFLDSDDVLVPDCLGCRVEVMSRNRDLDFAVCRTGVFLEKPGDLGRELDPSRLGDDLLRFLFFDIPWQTTASTWRRDVLEAIGAFDETLPSWQDVDLHVRAITSGFRYLRFDQIDHYMRWEDDPERVSMQQRQIPHLEAAISTIDKFERHVREGPGMDWVRQRALCGLYFRTADMLLQVKGLESALQIWNIPRGRRMAPISLHASGALLLLMQALKIPGAARLTNKWKGWVRFRINPDVLPA